MKFGQNQKSLKKVLLLSTAIVVTGFPLWYICPALAQDPWEEGPAYSANDMGGVGLVHNRTARFFDDGHFEFGTSFSNPQRKYYMTWQIMPRVETTFRYTDITNRPLQIPAIPQSERRFWSDLIGLHDRNSYLDRTFDVKVLLAKEGNIMPQLAFGLQDFLGTGIFSGEYLVASKRFGRFDFSLGLGWGQYAGRSSFGNPMDILGSNFKSRKNDFGKGGNFSVGQYFSGSKVGLFGGVEYSTQINGLSLKLEYDSDDPDVQIARGLRVMPGRFPVNVGAVYQPNSYFSINLGLLRGRAPVFGFALKTNFNDFGLPKKDPPAPVVIPRKMGRRDIVFAEKSVSEKQINGNWVGKIQQAVKSHKVAISFVAFEGGVAFIQVSSSFGTKEAVNDLSFISTLFSSLPRSINTLALTYSENNISKIRYHFRIAKNLKAGFLEIESMGLTLGAIQQKGLNTRVLLTVDQEEINLAGLVLLFESSEKISIKSNTNEMIIRPYQIKAQKQSEDIINRLKVAGVLPKNIQQRGQRLILEAPILQPNQITAHEAVSRIAEDWGVNSIQFKDNNYKFNRVNGLTLTDEEMSVLFQKVALEVGKQFTATYSLDIKGREAILYSVGTSWPQVPRFIGRTARVMANVLPPEIEVFTIVEIAGAIEVSRTSLIRSDIEKISSGTISPSELFNNTKFLKPKGGMTEANKGTKHQDIYPSFSWYAVPRLQQNIGDPNEGIYNADLDLAVGGSYSISPGLFVSVVARQKLMGDLDKIERVSDSVLPHVRSDIVKYLKSGDTTLSQIQLTYMKALSSDVYFRASGGIFEQMYGGVGAEVLYKPFDKPWAVGVDLAWVKKRGFNQFFSFQNYQILTGYASLYYDLPFWDMRAKVKAGRYLAGDRGVTIDLSRQFKSGVRVGAFSTFTNVSAADFGEGSFDKGFYIQFPMELFLQRSSREAATFAFKPITRDGGQSAAIGPELYSVVSGRGYREIKRTWGTIFN
jgi:hypothetical protein